ICVASAGNDNRKVLVYPAAFGNVVGVGSTTLDDHRSAFSNYGADLVTVAAPGEALVTTYPGNHYAMAWGTSFSSGLVSGATAPLASTSRRRRALSSRIRETDERQRMQAMLREGTNLFESRRRRLQIE